MLSNSVSMKDTDDLRPKSPHIDESVTLALINIVKKLKHPLVQLHNGI
jgi:hypothetical protein